MTPIFFIGGFWTWTIRLARSRSEPFLQASDRMVEIRICSLDRRGSPSMPRRPNRLVTVVVTRSCNSSSSAMISAGGAEKDFNIDTGSPALLPGVYMVSSLASRNRLMRSPL